MTNPTIKELAFNILGNWVECSVAKGDACNLRELNSQMRFKEGMKMGAVALKSFASQSSPITFVDNGDGVVDELDTIKINKTGQEVSVYEFVELGNDEKGDEFFPGTSIQQRYDMVVNQARATPEEKGGATSVDPEFTEVVQALSEDPAGSHYLQGLETFLRDSIKTGESMKLTQ